MTNCDYNSDSDSEVEHIKKCVNLVIETIRINDHDERMLREILLHNSGRVLLSKLMEFEAISCQQMIDRENAEFHEKYLKNRDDSHDHLIDEMVKQHNLV